jgi:hypothetical protein
LPIISGQCWKWPDEPHNQALNDAQRLVRILLVARTVARRELSGVNPRHLLAVISFGLCFVCVHATRLPLLSHATDQVRWRVHVFSLLDCGSAVLGTASLEPLRPALPCAGCRLPVVNKANVRHVPPNKALHLVWELGRSTLRSAKTLGSTNEQEKFTCIWISSQSSDLSDKMPTFTTPQAPQPSRLYPSPLKSPGRPMTNGRVVPSGIASWRLASWPNT